MRPRGGALIGYYVTLLMKALWCFFPPKVCMRLRVLVGYYATLPMGTPRGVFVHQKGVYTPRGGRSQRILRFLWLMSLTTRRAENGRWTDRLEGTTLCLWLCSLRKRRREVDHGSTDACVRYHRGSTFLLAEIFFQTTGCSFNPIASKFRGGGVINILFGFYV